MPENQQISHQHNLLPLLQNASHRSERLKDEADATHFARFNQKKSQNTLKAYRQDLQRFGIAWLGDTCPTDFGYQLTVDARLWFYITHGEVTAFVLWMQQQGYALSSINRALYTIRSYAKQAMLVGVISNEVYAKIEGIAGFDGKTAANVDEGRDLTRRDQLEEISVKKSDATRIPKDLLEVLLYGHQIDTLKGLRNAVLFNLLLQLGLRASEFADLKWADVDLERGQVRFYRRKVAKIQTMGLSTMLQSLLRLYMTQVPEPDDEDGKLLYGVTRGDKLGKNGLSAANISMIVKRFGQEIGLPTLSAHDLRHHWTTTLHEHGVDTLRLQRMGGWNSPRMLQRYVAEKSRVNEGLENPYLVDK
ncbi:MAG: tyrosine-type recombinase/integrase [Chloroflexota bacterium]